MDRFDADLAAMAKEIGDPQEQAKRFARYAAEEIEEARQINRRALGKDVAYSVAVDGREGAALTSVRANSVVIAEWRLVEEALEWIGLARSHRPVCELACPVRQWRRGPARRGNPGRRNRFRLRQRPAVCEEDRTRAFTPGHPWRLSNGGRSRRAPVQGCCRDQIRLRDRLKGAGRCRSSRTES